MTPTFKAVEKVLKDKRSLTLELAKLIADSAAEAIAARGVFTLGLSGGSMAGFVCNGLPSITTDWSAWRLLFCDERLVSVDSPDSTLQLYLTGLLDTTPLTRDQFLQVDVSLQPNEAATDYEEKLRSLLLQDTPWPRLDLLLLGVGPDGHTASLFPQHPQLQEQQRWVVAVTDSPKPPPARVTLTLPVLNNARRCIMAFAGADKADIVKTLKAERDADVTATTLPAARVRPTDGDLLWLMDAAAASKL
ncbi:6-phosphogluconolactonase [Hyalella azteca]|uniref:6-phosphogluconolactonase n=1 Tax=Hyalella azteca TaxID=294128 RepID=A0A8B7P4E3_HYAAZ|nr:6-phosphogluconolactonase [Hyalella azteca]